MNSHKTVVFADMTGSTALYEALGNEGAAAVVAPLTQAMGVCIQQHGGRVVKSLGDGVLGLFAEPGDAVLAAAELMREHRQWIGPQARESHVGIHIGLASGEVVEVDGDCYGDAVNVAARLCERADDAEIWATESVVAGLRAPRGMCFVRLGHLEMRGKAEPLVTYQIEWRAENRADLTVHSELRSDLAALESDTGPAQIQLSWPGAYRLFSSMDIPVNVGRAPDSHLCIADPRVSRVHARLDWPRRLRAHRPEQLRHLGALRGQRGAAAAAPRQLPPDRLGRDRPGRALRGRERVHHRLPGLRHRRAPAGLMGPGAAGQRARAPRGPTSPVESMVPQTITAPQPSIQGVTVSPRNAAP